MNCQRCTTNGAPTKMHHVVTTIGGYSLERYADSDIHSGYTCYQCGAWFGDSPLVKVPEVPPVDMSLVRPSGKRAPTTKPLSLHRVAVGEKLKKGVMERLNIIEELRKEGLSWLSVSLKLKEKDGFRISYSALRVHYANIVAEQTQNNYAIFA